MSRQADKHRRDHKRWGITQKQRIESEWAAVPINGLAVTIDRDKQIMASERLRTCTIQMRTGHVTVQCLVTMEGERAAPMPKDLGTTKWVPALHIYPLPDHVGHLCHMLAVSGLPEKALKLAMEYLPENLEADVRTS